MKKLLCAVTALMALTLLAATGCAQKELDFSKVEAVFQNAPGFDRTLLDKGLAAAKAGQYPQAFESLQKVALGSRLSKAQRVALQDFNREIKARIKSK